MAPVAVSNICMMAYICAAWLVIASPVTLGPLVLGLVIRDRGPMRAEAIGLRPWAVFLPVVLLGATVVTAA